MLQNERDCRVLADLCPLFKGRIKEDSIKGSFQVQLNVFEYYIFWFAYYSVCRGNSENSDTVRVRRSRKFRLEIRLLHFQDYRAISVVGQSRKLSVVCIYAFFIHIFVHLCQFLLIHTNLIVARFYITIRVMIILLLIKPSSLLIP